MTSQGQAPSSSPCSRAPSPLPFPPIEERVEEEERAAEETARCPPSPLAHYYSGLRLSHRYQWPPFLGDWAFQDGQPRRVSTGCLEEGEEGNSQVVREVEDSYSKDDLAVHRHVNAPHLHPQPAFLLDLHNVTVSKRDSVCDIEFHFPLFPASSPSSPLGGADEPSSPRLQRPRHLPISPTDTCPSAPASLLTSHSSVPPDWEVVVRRHSYVHVKGTDWVFFICLLVFVCLCLDIAIHNFLLILLGLQAMYYLLLSFV